MSKWIVNHILIILYFNFSSTFYCWCLLICKESWSSARMFVGGNDRGSNPTTVARYHPLGNCINAQQSGNSSLKTPQFTSISEILRCCLATILTHGELSSDSGIFRIKCAHMKMLSTWASSWAIVPQIQWAADIFLEPRLVKFGYSEGL